MSHPLPELSHCDRRDSEPAPHILLPPIFVPFRETRVGAPEYLSTLERRAKAPCLQGKTEPSRRRRLPSAHLRPSQPPLLVRARSTIAKQRWWLRHQA